MSSGGVVVVVVVVVRIILNALKNKACNLLAY
jgi:hypothetical protein